MVVLWANPRNRLRVSRLTQRDEVERLVELFEVVAAEEGWQPDGALRRWRNRSDYFALEVCGELAGGLQLVRPDFRGELPCRSVWPEVPTQRQSPCAHIAVMALAGSHRGQSAHFWHLAAEMWRHCVGQGIATLFIEVTPRVLPLYLRLGWPLQIVGERRSHWGEDCFLCTLGIPEVAETLLRRAERSPYYRQIIAQAFRVAIPTRNARPVSHATAP